MPGTLRAETKVSLLRGGEIGSMFPFESGSAASAVIRHLLSGRVWENSRRHKEKSGKRES